ncbi:hypothetical protein WMF04_24005 [Sorangium sp. So ce260]|uniref:hypothetical protein n=1 Tax=Sorangium sp. So ce260 TaxID=3133291 RepID=UPI003F61216B
MAWLRWHLLGDEGDAGKGMFLGTSCGLCGTGWDIQQRTSTSMTTRRSMRMRTREAFSLQHY